MFSETKTVADIRQMMSIIHLVSNSTIFKGVQFVETDVVQAWLENFAETLCLDNLTLMNEIVKKMHFTCCIEMIKLFP